MVSYVGRCACYYTIMKTASVAILEYCKNVSYILNMTVKAKYMCRPFIHTIDPPSTKYTRLRNPSQILDNIIYPLITPQVL